MEIQKYKRRAKHNVSESTLNSRLSGQRRLKKFIGEDREPTPEDVEEWIDSLIDEYEAGEIKASTIRGYYKSVRYYFAVVLGQEDELDHISNWLPTATSDPGEYLSEEEWELFLDNCRVFSYRALFNIMYYYARRPTEVILLNEEDIDFEEETITFNILKKKEHGLPVLETEDGTERPVLRATFELTDAVKDVLTVHMNHKPDIEKEIMFDGEPLTVHPLFTGRNGRVSYSTVYRQFKKIIERAGIEKNVTPKGLRHSRATHLDWSGQAPGNIARDMLIHDPDTNVISRYIHDRGEQQVRDVMSVESGD